MVIKLATTEEIRTIEAAADKAGISYQEMMERAGQAAANRALALLSGIASPFITILVGPGNNGGELVLDREQTHARLSKRRHRKKRRPKSYSNDNPRSHSLPNTQGGPPLCHGPIEQE